MKLRDESGCPVNGRCEFVYKGHLVTIFIETSDAGVTVSDAETGLPLSLGFGNVEAAIAWIDARDNGRRMMEGANR